MKRSRRKFLRLLAAGSAAAIASPAASLAAVAKKKPVRAAKPAPPAAPPALPAAVAAEIAKQKVTVAGSLKAVRAYALPPGSDLAFTFRPVRSRRKARTP